ncbi:MAG: histidine phosphatase family protein [Nitrospira sp.]|nr:histidine phosphatase family protein [Nitrospira sp.]MDR4473048.1 histidine phosphatase family protein [Nitrospira sp.]MDR4476709.1 histidine phosphatase family protein [Nitrospira sp.]HAP40616.1 phosphohistidine phosphatase SixA [Nitrospira sp.]
MDCLFFRHGIAVERDTWTGEERRRPLTHKGRARTRQSGKGLLALRLTPTHILSSPLTRARQTAVILQALLEEPIAIRMTAALEPEADPQAICALLNTVPPDAFVWCIGHEPHLSATAGLLLTGTSCHGFALKKAGACLIHVDHRMRPGTGRLDWWLTASQLRALA